jgi:hypothetical protein
MLTLEGSFEAMGSGRASSHNIELNKPFFYHMAGTTPRKKESNGCCVVGSQGPAEVLDAIACCELKDTRDARLGGQSKDTTYCTCEWRTVTQLIGSLLIFVVLKERMIST